MRAHRGLQHLPDEGLRYEFAESTPAEKQAYKDEHWSQDLQKARDAGRRMAEKISK